MGNNVIKAILDPSQTPKTSKKSFFFDFLIVDPVQASILVLAGPWAKVQSLKIKGKQNSPNRTALPSGTIRRSSKRNEFLRGAEAPDTPSDGWAPHPFRSPTARKMRLRGTLAPTAMNPAHLDEGRYVGDVAVHAVHPLDDDEHAAVLEAQAGQHPIQLLGGQRPLVRRTSLVQLF